MSLEYPKGFPKQFIDRTELAYVLAFREYVKDARKTSFVDAIIKTQCAFAQGLVVYAEALGLDLATRRDKTHEFLRRLVIQGHYDFGLGNVGELGNRRRLEPDPISHWDGSIDPPFMEKLRATPEFTRYEDLLLGLVLEPTPPTGVHDEKLPIVESDLETAEGRDQSIKRALRRWDFESSHEFSLEEFAAIVGKDRTTISHWQAIREGKFGAGLSKTILNVLNISGVEAWARLKQKSFG